MRLLVQGPCLPAESRRRGTDRDNGSARIQTRRVKTRTTPTWTVTREEQGLRLDRFLAAPGRLGSRGRVRVALERGKVFRQRRRGLGDGRRLAGGAR